jgi:DNA-binding FrmR family transcriptional regulator
MAGSTNPLTPLTSSALSSFMTTTDPSSARSPSTDSEAIAHSHPHSHDDSGHSRHPHIHDEESLKRIVNRISRIEGHIRGVKMMVQESRPCPDVLVQIAAIRGALDRVARIILDEHLTECVGRAAREGNIDVEIEELKSALDRFLP